MLKHQGMGISGIINRGRPMKSGTVLHWAATILIFLSWGASAQDEELGISIDDSGEYLKAVFENSVFRGVFSTNSGGPCNVEHAFKEWTVKSSGRDQAGSYIEACAHRGPARKMELVLDNDNEKRLRVEFGCDAPDAFINEYTIYANSPVIKIDYLKYGGWTNTVDISSPGGAGNGQYLFYGAEEYNRQVRDYVLYEESYWNTHDGGGYSNDPIDGGPLNYNGHMIMCVANPENDEGWGRVMPIFEEGVCGGMKIVKLLFNAGFETFPGTGQGYRPAYTGYLFLFTRGLDSAVNMGVEIVDGTFTVPDTEPDPVSINPLPATVTHHRVKFIFSTTSFGSERIWNLLGMNRNKSVPASGLYIKLPETAPADSEKSL
jgi:hypothetical protein